MNVRMGLLAGLVVGASVGAWYVLDNGQARPAPPDNQQLQAMAASIKAVNTVHIENAAGVLFRAEREDGQWYATHMDDTLRFPVDTKALSTLLRRLEKARLVEQKTASEALYPRLGVEELSAEDAASVLLSLETGQAQWQWLVGKRAKGQRGHFVRAQEAKTSLLIDQVIPLPVTASEWLSQQILTFSSGQISQVVYTAADGSALLLKRGEGEAWQARAANTPQAGQVDPQSLSYPGVLAQTIDDLVGFKYLTVQPWREASWQASEQAGQVAVTLRSGQQWLLAISTPDELGHYHVHIRSDAAPEWLNDWLFVVSGYQGRSLLTTTESLTAAPAS